jgi:hypothetical protein
MKKISVATSLYGKENKVMVLFIRQNEWKNKKEMYATQKDRRV